MLAIRPSLAPPSYAASPGKPARSPSAYDAERREVEADMVSAQRTMICGSVVQKAGKTAFAVGLAGTGCALIGLPVPLAGALGFVGGGLLLRATGAGLALNGFAALQKANVRAARLGPAPAGATPTAPPAPSATRERLVKIGQAVGSGVIVAGMVGGSALLTSHLGLLGGAVGVIASGVVASMTVNPRDAAIDHGASTIGGLFAGGLGSAAGACGPIGVGIACAAGVAFGTYLAVEVLRGRMEPLIWAGR